MDIGIIEDKKESKPKKLEPFASDIETENFLSTMDEEKEIFERPVLDDDEDEDLISATEKIGYTNIDKDQKIRSNDTARFLVKKADKGLAVAFASYAHSSNTEDFEADQESIDEMVEYWGFYLQDIGASLPTWVMGLIVTMVVISKKFNAAKQIREANIRAEKAESELQEIKNQTTKKD